MISSSVMRQAGEPGARAALRLSALVAEALEKLASPDARELILGRALKASGRAAVPEDPTALAAFVGGPLCDSVERYVGTSAAEALIADLEPILRQAVHHESAIRPRDPAIAAAGETRRAILVV